MEEFVPIIKIETGDSERTVKGLKQEITQLRDAILNLEEGSADYSNAVKQLQANQRELDKVMSLTKNSATALDGSYDALTHQMSLLKKEWKATNDEARRNELSTQINDINNQLKNLDGEIGNFQRNVGNYQSALDGLDTSTLSFGDSMKQMNEAIEPTKAKFEAVQKISAGVASGFAAVQGAAALLGMETGKLEEAFVKVQSAMAIAQGIGGLGDLVEGLGKAKVAFGDMGKQIVALTKTMGKAGWIGIIIAAVAAIGLLWEGLTRTNRQIENGVYGQKKLNEIMKEAKLETAELVATTRLYEQMATDVNMSYETRIKASDNLLTNLGKEINETNRAAAMNGELADSVNDVIAAYEKQAKAKAAIDMLTKAQEKLIEIQASSPNFWDKMFTWDVSSWFDGDGQWWNDDDFGADRRDKRLAKAQKAYNALAKSIKDSGVLDGFGAVGSDGTALKNEADKRIAEIERLNDREKALALENAKTQKEIDKIEYDYAVKLMKDKLAAYRKYEAEARKLGNQGQDEAAEFALKAFEIETSAIYQDIARKKQLYTEDYNNVMAYYEQQENAAKFHYDVTRQYIDKEYATQTEKNEKYINNEIELQEETIRINEEKLEYLYKNEEVFGAEILELEKTLQDQRIALIDTQAEQEIAARRSAKERIYSKIKAMTDEYTAKEFEQTTDFIPELKNNTFLQELFGSTKKERQYEEETFTDSQAGYDRSIEHLTALKDKYNELLPNAENLEEQLDIEQEIADLTYQIKEEEYYKEKELRDKQYAEEKKTQEGRVALVHASLQATSQILNSIADMYESNDEEAEKNAKKIKNLRIASAIIDTIQGAVTAYASAQSLGVPMGPIVGGINAAAVVAMGLANVAKIRNTEVSANSAPSGGGIGASVTPAASTFVSELPVQYTRNITSASEVEELNKDTRVYILESDIQSSNQRVKIRESESSF